MTDQRINRQTPTGRREGEQQEKYQEDCLRVMVLTVRIRVGHQDPISPSAKQVFCLMKNIDFVGLCVQFFFVKAILDSDRFEVVYLCQGL